MGERTPTEDPCSSPGGGGEVVDNGCEYMSRLALLYNNPKFSDIRLNVAGQSVFHAHKLLLATASDVFEQMLTNESWMDREQRELLLQEPDDCVAVFGDFIRYIYSGKVLLTIDTVLGLLVLADKYNVSDLKQCCVTYMNNHLVSTPCDNKAVQWFQYANACVCEPLQQSCVDYIVLNMDTVTQSPDWVCLETEHLEMFLQRSDLVIHSEHTLLMAVIDWLRAKHRVHKLRENLSRILPYVRFPMILPEHLSKFEESGFGKEHSDIFAPYLLVAYRYHALSIRGCKDHAWEVPLTQFRYRNYTDENYSIFVDIVRKGFKSCPRVSSKVERPLNLPAHIGNPAQDRQCKMKVVFYPHGYYMTSFWQGQLNISKATDDTKLIVSHRGGMEVREVEISVVVYAIHNQVKHAKYVVTEPHIFETHGTFEMENIIRLGELRADDSPYLIDDSLHLRVFIRPVNFQKPLA
ncbi:hypothetical protein NP493_260g04000 [Ridgeia piscesae]|uniref:BTB domain-containing protein n=1 Tax=Ridgeia piscesae TaxID=27915 RepID=A0AAD9NY25_RIDPI|nr:hypothetical protein NP493_260g04000 [Ridgeia piscesae]